jgi:hypothetical protein
MPTIIIKRPHSSPKIIDVVSKNLPDLYTELNIRAIHEPIGTGLVLIVQRNTEYDEPNIIYEGKCILGTIYVVRATKERITDISGNDLDYFFECVDFLTESEH